MTVKVAKGRFRRGDVVEYQFGSQRVQARVIEPRGPLGIGGRHIYRIRQLSGMDEPVEFEMPEDDLIPATLSTEDVVNYLAAGGLVDMLGRNQGGGRNPPRVWLTFNPVGQLTHTFIEENGVRGGGYPVLYFGRAEDFQAGEGEGYPIPGVVRTSHHRRRRGGASGGHILTAPLTA